MKPNQHQYLNWTGGFFGDGLDLEHYEIMMMQYVPAKDRKIEAELMTTKWFDYRLMHPVQATYYFYRQYKDAYREYYRRAINHEAAAFVKPTKQHDFLLSREAMSFWRLRQAVDALGIRYDFFLNYAFGRLRILVNGRPLPPRPGQLKSEEILTDAYVAWQGMCESSLQIACSPYFTTSHYIHAQMQVDYENFLIEQIKKRRIPHYALGSCLYLYDAVRIEAAIEAFDEGTLQSAIEHLV